MQRFRGSRRGIFSPATQSGSSKSQLSLKDILQAPTSSQIPDSSFASTPLISPAVGSISTLLGGQASTFLQPQSGFAMTPLVDSNHPFQTPLIQQPLTFSAPLSTDSTYSKDETQNNQPSYRNILGKELIKFQQNQISAPSSDDPNLIQNSIIGQMSQQSTYKSQWTNDNQHFQGNGFELGTESDILSPEYGIQVKNSDNQSNFNNIFDGKNITFGSLTTDKSNSKETQKTKAPSILSISQPLDQIDKIQQLNNEEDDFPSNYFLNAPSNTNSVYIGSMSQSSSQESASRDDEDEDYKDMNEVNNSKKQNKILKENIQQKTSIGLIDHQMKLKQQKNSKLLSTSNQQASKKKNSKRVIPNIIMGTEAQKNLFKAPSKQQMKVVIDKEIAELSNMFDDPTWLPEVWRSLEQELDNNSKGLENEEMPDSENNEQNQELLQTEQVAHQKPKLRKSQTSNLTLNRNQSDSPNGNNSMSKQTGNNTQSSQGNQHSHIQRPLKKVKRRRPTLSPDSLHTSNNFKKQKSNNVEPFDKRNAEKGKEAEIDPFEKGRKRRRIGDEEDNSDSLFGSEMDKDIDQIEIDANVIDQSNEGQQEDNIDREINIGDNFIDQKDQSLQSAQQITSGRRNIQKSAKSNNNQSNPTVINNMTRSQSFIQPLNNNILQSKNINKRQNGRSINIDKTIPIQSLLQTALSHQTDKNKSNIDKEKQIQQLCNQDDEQTFNDIENTKETMIIEAEQETNMNNKNINSSSVQQNERDSNPQLDSLSSNMIQTISSNSSTEQNQETIENKRRNKRKMQTYMDYDMDFQQVEADYPSQQTELNVNVQENDQSDEKDETWEKSPQKKRAPTKQMKSRMNQNLKDSDLSQMNTKQKNDNSNDNSDSSTGTITMRFDPLTAALASYAQNEHNSFSKVNNKKEEQQQQRTIIGFNGNPNQLENQISNVDVSVKNSIIGNQNEDFNQQDNNKDLLPLIIQQQPQNDLYNINSSMQPLHNQHAQQQNEFAKEIDINNNQLNFKPISPQTPPNLNQSLINTAHNNLMNSINTITPKSLISFTPNTNTSFSHYSNSHPNISLQSQHPQHHIINQNIDSQINQDQIKQTNNSSSELQESVDNNVNDLHNIVINANASSIKQKQPLARTQLHKQELEVDEQLGQHVQKVEHQTHENKNSVDDQENDFDWLTDIDNEKQNINMPYENSKERANLIPKNNIQNSIADTQLFSNQD